MFRCVWELLVILEVIGLDKKGSATELQEAGNKFAEEVTDLSEFGSDLLMLV